MATQPTEAAWEMSPDEERRDREATAAGRASYEPWTGSLKNQPRGSKVPIPPPDPRRAKNPLSVYPDQPAEQQPRSPIQVPFTGEKG